MENKLKEVDTAHSRCPYIVAKYRFDNFQKFLDSAFVKEFVSFAYLENRHIKEITMYIKLDRQISKEEESIFYEKLFSELSKNKQTFQGDYIDEEKIIIEIDFKNIMIVDKFLS